ncbi:TonB-dependent receptor, partial [bacterium]|nr:TonB-dependent receptor [bacterium]
STLWGSDAVGGVIQIITRSGGLEKNAWLSEELGSHGSYKSSFGFSGASGAQDYSFTISRHDIDGFSDALRTNLNLFGGQKEEDGYANLSARINLGFQHKGDAKTRFLLQRIRSKKDLDGFFDSNGPTDQNSTSETRDLYYRIEHRRSPQSQKFEEVYSFSSMRFDSLSNLDSISAFGPFAQKTRFVGSVKSLSWQRDYFIEDHLLTLGWELEQNRGDSLNDQDLKSGITAYYLQARLQNSENFSIGLGGRRNQHRSFGSHTTWKIAPSYRLRKMRFYGSYATGFKAPTLFELHSQQKFANNLNQLVLVNNPDLKPALNRGFSLGVENTIGRDTLLSLTLFQNNIENSIKFVFPPFPQVTPFGFVNTGSIETSGFEVALGSSFSQKWSYQAHFTRSKAKEFPSGLQIRREPQHHFQFNLQYQSGADSTWSLNFRQSGGQVERYEGPFAPAQYTKGFKVVDLSYSRQINETNEWGLRVENLLDSDYQEVFGYDTGGQKIYLTLKHYF